MKWILFLLLLFLVYPAVNAYEINTHATLTAKAYARSDLYGGQLSQVLGIDQTEDPFNDRYYDNSINAVRSRFGNKYENKLIDDLGYIPYSLVGWLMRGSIREDDIPTLLKGKNPPDDPDGQIVRVLNHFYDPVNHRPLTVLGAALGKDAPTWVIGVEDAFSQPNTEDSNRRNHFTIRDARVSQWRALTGQDRT